MRWLVTMLALLCVSQVSAYPLNSARQDGRYLLGGDFVCTAYARPIVRGEETVVVALGTEAFSVVDGCGLVFADRDGLILWVGRIVNAPVGVPVWLWEKAEDFAIIRLPEGYETK